MRSVVNPIFVNFGFLGNHREIIPNSTHELYVSINNRGTENAVIDVSIEVVDENSSALIQWIHPKRTRIEIDAGQEKTVSFQVQIPDNAWPYDYRYDVVLDSPDHYPQHTPLSYPQILKVLPAPAVLMHGGEDPRFSLNPETSSTQPKTIKPGQTLEVEVLVENRTALVDRYYLICSDLKPDFFSISYPEIKDQYGLIIESDGLELNPGTSGLVKLKFHPPYNATAGNYYPTIRLASVNNPRLNLLDIVYLHIPPFYGLELEIDTIKDRIKNPKTESGEYQLNISNQGNLERNLIVKTRNRGWGSLSFSVDPDFKVIAPGASSHVQILARPLGRWWNRPFYGVGRDFKIGVELEDINSLPLPQELPEAKLTWEPYPKKWLIFCIVLLSLLLVGGAIGIAIAVWNTFLKQPPAPNITELSPTKAIFQESNNEAVQLNWTVQNPKNIRRLVLKQQGMGVDETKTFNFREGIPVELSLRNPTQTNNFCSIKNINKDSVLVCRGIVTSAQKPGQYQFELKAFTQKSLTQAASVLKTDTVWVIPAGLPNVTEFLSPQPEYILENSPNPLTSVLLNWEIANPAQIKQIRLVGLMKDGTVATRFNDFNFQGNQIPKALQPFCKIVNRLSCKNFPMQVRKPGQYTFRLSIEGKKSGGENVLTKVTDVILVKSLTSVKVPPKIKASTIPNSVPTSQLGSRGGNQSPQTDNSNAFIPPALWPLPEAPRSSSPYRSNPPSRSWSRPSSPASSANRSQSLQQANDIVKGLVVANQVGLIPTKSQTWYKVQSTVTLLREGSRLDTAGQRSGVSMDILSSLIAWGQNQNLPQKSPQNSARAVVPSVKAVPPAASSKPIFPSSVEKPPEPLWGSSKPDPLWGSSQPSVESSAPQNSRSSEPLW